MVRYSLGSFCASVYALVVAPVNRKTPSASASTLTKNTKSKSFYHFLSENSIGIIQAIKPPAPKICGSINGPPVTTTRVKLRDGRYLAYNINGVIKDKAKFKIVDIHGFDMCRLDFAIQNVSPELVERLGIQIVAIDRPGYGESDPHPNRTKESLALDIEELADKLELGSKFYVTGYSMGGEGVWSCLHYIPHRLAGAVLIAPKINYWLPGLPANLSKQGFNQLLTQDRWSLRVAHYVPWLTYWWNTQQIFPHFSFLWKTLEIYSIHDIQTLPRLSFRKLHKKQVRQQGDYETVHKDLMNGYGSRDIDPTGIKNPFPNANSNGEGSVHLWHGDDDKVIPVILQRYIGQKLPWIQYHEVSGAGHLFPFAQGMADKILKTLLKDK